MFNLRQVILEQTGQWKRYVLLSRIARYTYTLKIYQRMNNLEPFGTLLK